MPSTPSTASVEALIFAVKKSDIFVWSSLLAASGALLALHGAAWVFAPPLSLICYLAARALGAGTKGSALLAAVFLAFFFAGQTRLAALHPDAGDLSQLRAASVAFTGFVVSSKVKECQRGQFVSAVVCPERLISPYSRKLTGRVLVHIGPFEPGKNPLPACGGKFVFTGRLLSPRARVFSFEYDERRRLALQGIYCQVTCQSSDVSAAGTGEKDQHRIWCLLRVEELAAQLLRGADWLRASIISGHTAALGQERGSLLTSMVLGDRAVSLSDEIKLVFNRVGLSHLLAASGLNLTIIVGACFYCFALARRGKRTAGSPLLQSLGALACVLFFVSLAGASPSVTRATIMCLVLLWSDLLLRRLARGAALAGALLLAVILDPLSILDVGLELSYGATFGIIYFFPILDRSVPGKARIWRWLIAACAVVFAAQLAVLPVQICCFQKISTLTLPANILAEPLVAPITVAGFVSSLFFSASSICGAAFPPAAPLISCPAIAIDWLCGYLIDLLLWLTRSLGSMPFSYLLLAAPSAVAVVFYYLAVVISYFAGQVKPARGALLALAAGFAFTFLTALESSCPEIVMTENCVLIGRPLRPPVLISTETPFPRHKENGYLPAYHRDFIQSYLRCQSSDACREFKIAAGKSCTFDLDRGAVSLLQRPAGACGGPFIDIVFDEEGRTEIKHGLPAASVAIEKAQGAAYMRFCLWGRLYRVFFAKE